MSARRRTSRSPLAAAFTCTAALALALLAAGVARAEEATTAAAHWVLPHPVERALKNQMKFYVVEDHRMPVVTFRMTIRAGAADEAAEKAGLANLMLEAMRRGSETTTAAALEREVDDLGGEIGTEAGRDEMSITGRFLSRDWRKGLDLLKTIALDAAFRAQDVEDARKAVLEAIEQDRLHPASVAQQHADALVYGTHPYGRPAHGDGSSVSNITREELVKFHDQFFVPNLCQLVVVGDVVEPAVTTQVEAEFRTWSPAPPPTRPAPDLPVLDANRIRILDSPGLKQAELRIGFGGVPRAHADFFPLLVLNDVLGGGARSRLDAAFRSVPGQTPSGASAFDFGRDRGAFYLSATCAPPAVGATVDAALSVLTDLSTKGATQAEVDAAKQVLLGATPVALQGQETIASQWAMVDLFGLGPDYFDRYADRLRAVTLADVNRVARERLHADKLAIVCVASADSAAKALAKYGTPEVLEYVSPTGTVPQSQPSTAMPSEAIAPAALARAHAVVDRAVKAHGGALKLKAVKDVSTLSSVSFTTPNGPLDADLLMTIRMPDRTRIEMNMLGQRGVQVLSGDRGYATSGSAITDLTGEQAQSMRSGLKVQVLPLLSHLARGDVPIGWFGTDVVNGDSVDVIWVFDPDATSKASFSHKTGLLVRLEQEEPAMFGMGKVPMSRLYSDYRAVEGYQVPFKIERYARGERLVVDTLKSYEINRGVADSQFQRPVR